MARDRETLTQAFLALGENAADAKAMAKAELGRGSPQLARIMFLKTAWRLIIDEDKKRDGEVAWIESWLRWGRSQKQPQSGVGAAIERLLASGADPDDLTDVVRAMQFELLFNFCDVLDEEGLDELRPLLPKGLDVGWRLYEVGPDGKPTRAIESLHESVGSYDPAGREGQPRSRDTKPSAASKKPSAAPKKPGAAPKKPSVASKKPGAAPKKSAASKKPSPASKKR